MQHIGIAVVYMSFLHGTKVALHVDIMVIAIANFQGSVSPVFDVSDKLSLVEVVGGKEVQRKDVLLMERDPFLRAKEMTAISVEVLLCGAVSYAMETALITAGISVVGFLCGGLEMILGAFLKEGLTDSRFLMPGCVGGRRRRRFRCSHGRQEAPMRGGPNKRR